MKLIAAYPCLGKTTLYNQHEDIYFDREFNESRSTLGMSEEQISKFFKACADLISVQLEANHHRVMFITEDERLLIELSKRGIRPIIVFPNAFDFKYMEQYKRNVIERSGLDWYKRVLASEIDTLQGRIRLYKKYGLDVRLTDFEKPYIENVVDL